MLLSPRGLKSLNSIEKIKPSIMCAPFNRNPCTTIVSSYSPTDASDETDFNNFKNGLFFLVRHIPKYNVVIIGGDMNGHIDKDRNKKVCLHNSPNRNGKYIDFFFDNLLSCLNTVSQNREGKRYSIGRLYIHQQELHKSRFHIALKPLGKEWIQLFSLQLWVNSRAN